MKLEVLHRLKGRLRVACGRYTFNKQTAHAMNEYLKVQGGVISADTSYRTGTVLVKYDGIAEKELIEAIENITIEQLKNYDKTSVVENMTEEFVVSLASRSLFNLLVMPVLPKPIGFFMLIKNTFGYVKKAVKSCLDAKKITIEVLDATAIVTSIVQGNTGSAKSIMFLLAISDLIENWTLKKSKANLARYLEINIDNVWVKVNDEEVQIPLTQVQEGDKVVIRTGSIIPIDGNVVEGDALVNQSTLTGEPLPIRREIDDYVYAGTVVEEGSIVIETVKTSNETRLSKIIDLVDESELNKSAIQRRTENLADKIVPISFASALLTFALTRNVIKATTFLLVDYSCAIKLSGSLSVLGALQESTKNKIFVKGGKYLELLSKADTIVFDKTGTLTYAEPVVKDVIALDGYDRDEVLKLAACLEEHFPHPVAKAVVLQAEKEELNHREEHGDVEYVIAHGIASKLNGKRVLIGSKHFILEDEKVEANPEDLEKINGMIATESSLYLAIAGKLAGVILIDDPIRFESRDTIHALQAQGFEVLMLTGDSEAAAKNAADALDLDNYKAQLLPEDKASYIKKLKEEGRTVVMVGDGVNDTPALSAADVGIAMKTGSDIAREVADITMLTSDISKLVDLKMISDRLLIKVKRNYAFIVLFNSGLIGFSLMNVITPSTSSFLHNMSTVGVSVTSLRPTL